MMRRIVSCETLYFCATIRSGSLFSTTRCMIIGQCSVDYHIRVCWVWLPVLDNEEGCYFERVHLPTKGVAPFDTICLRVQGRGRKLVIENSTPVGSGRFRDRAQDPRGVLGMSFSCSLLSVKRAVWQKLTREHAG